MAARVERVTRRSFTNQSDQQLAGARSRNRTHQRRWFQSCVHNVEPACFLNPPLFHLSRLQIQPLHDGGNALGCLLPDGLGVIVVVRAGTLTLNKFGLIPIIDIDTAIAGRR